MVINPNNSLYQNWTLNNMKVYWATDSTTNSPIFDPYFQESDSFKFLARCMSVTSTATPREPRYNLFLDILSPAFQSSYTPHKVIAVDESMIMFKGGISFRQYL